MAPSIRLATKITTIGKDTRYDRQPGLDEPKQARQRKSINQQSQQTKESFDRRGAGRSALVV
jgi:hypothetical protein